MAKHKRITIPAEVRKYVHQRDNYQCRFCGKTGQETQLEVDHIISLATGGSNDLSNLQTLCRPCNRRKNKYRDPRTDRFFNF
jgi:5-methylcytosine-specific restriction protein A